MSIRETWSRNLGYARDAVRQVPAELILALLAALTLSLSIEDVIDDSDMVVRLLMTSAVAFFPVAATTLAHALGRIDLRRRVVLTGVSLLVTLGWVWGYFDPDLVARAWQTGMLVVIGLGLLVLAPSLHGGVARREHTWVIAWRVLLRLVVVSLFALAWMLGLMAAVGAVDTLFDLSMNQEIYGHIMAWCTVGLVPWLTAAGVSEFIAPFDPQAPQRVPVVFSRWVFTPLLVIYSLILWAYVARILLTGEVPANVVSPLLMGAGVLGVLATLVAEPDARAAAPHLSTRIVRAFPAYFLPLVPVAAYALWIRVGQYGWTESRWLRAMLLVALTAFAVDALARWIRRLPLPQSSAVLIFLVVTALATVGPLSMSAVSKRSQSRLLLQELAQMGYIAGEPLDAARVAAADAAFRTPATDPLPGLWRVPNTLSGQIRDRLRWLQNHHGTAAMQAVVVTPALPHDSSEAVADWLGLAADRWQARHYAMRYLSRHGQAPWLVDFPARIHDVAFSPNAMESSGRTADGVGWEIEGTLLTLTWSTDATDETSTFDLAPVLQWVAETSGDAALRDEFAQLMSPQGQLLIRSAQIERTVSDEFAVRNLQANWAYRLLAP